MTNILTLRLDASSQAHFDTLRQHYFPPERNHIAAHLTLFHTLPDSAEVDTVLADAAQQQAPFRMIVSGVRSLGKGVAYRIQSAELTALHARLQRAFESELSPQDRQRFQPHIVVQNKVTPAAARALLAQLEATFASREIEAHGLDLWHYLGGPWQHASTFAFTCNG